MPKDFSLNGKVEVCDKVKKKKYYESSSKDSWLVTKTTTIASTSTDGKNELRHAKSQLQK